MAKRIFNTYRPKAVFFDRDGVINPLITREDGKLTSPWNVKEFKLLPNADKSFMKLRTSGFMSFIVTNQPGIEHGDMKQTDLDEINTYMRSKLSFVDIACATDTTSNLYKPNNGMIEQFARHYDILREKSFLVGDRWKDIVPGKKSGLTTILVGDTKYDPPEEYKDIVPDYKVKDIYEATCLILEIDNARF